MSLRAFFRIVFASVAALSLLLCAQPASAQIELTLGVPLADELASAGSIKCYNIHVDAGEHLLVFVDKDESWLGRLRVAFDHLPSESEASDSSIDVWQDQVLEIPETKSGTYYVSVSAGWNVGWEAGSYSITAMTEDMLPSLELGTSCSDALEGTQDVKWYRLADFSGGRHLLIFLDKPDWWVAGLVIRSGRLKTYDVDSSSGTWQDQVLEIPETKSGTYYVSVSAGWNVGWEAGSYSITAMTEDMLPSLELGTSHSDALEGTQDVKWYRLADFSGGRHLLVFLDKPDSWSARILIRSGRLETDDADSSCDIWQDQVLEIPETESGTYYVSVSTGWEGGWGAGSYVITAVTEDMLPDLTTGVGREGHLCSAQDAVYYHLELEQPDHLIVSLQKSTAWRARLSIRYARIDTLDAATSDDVTGDQVLDIPAAQPGSYYIVVSSGHYWSWEFGSYMIMARTSFMNVLVSGVEPSGVGNSGPITLRIKGGVFEEGCSVWFTKADHAETIVTASTIAVIDAANIAARFNFNGAEIGSKWDLWVQNPGGQTAGGLRDAVTLEKPFVDPWVSLAAPNWLRVGRASTLSLDFGNRGNIDLYDSVIRLSFPKRVAATVSTTEISWPFADEDRPAWFPDCVEVNSEWLMHFWILNMQAGGGHQVGLSVNFLEGNPGEVISIPVAVYPAPESEFSRTGDYSKISSSATFGMILDAITAAIEQSRSSGGSLGMRGPAGAKAFRSLGLGHMAVPPTRKQKELDYERKLLDWREDKTVMDFFFLIGGSAAGLCGFWGVPIALGALSLMAEYNNTQIGKEHNRSQARHEAFFNCELRRSCEPNDKLASCGYQTTDGDGGILRYARGDVPIDYIIRSENLATAGVIEAENIVVTDVLDEHLDWETLEIGGTIMSSKEAHPQVTLNRNARTVCWTFVGINLPPNWNPPEGEGTMTFRIKPVAGLPSGTIIQNTAAIVFDINDPVITPTVSTIIDNGAPESHVLPLETPQTSESFEVSWTGSDDAGGSGIRGYTIYVSDQDAAYTVWLSNATETTATFTGTPGHTYRFYSVAQDNVGHNEAAPKTADTTTHVRTDTPLNISLSLNASEYAPGEMMRVYLSGENTGGDLSIDLYSAVMLPGGEIVVYPGFTNLNDPPHQFLYSGIVPRGLSVSDLEFFAMPVPEGLPAGSYIWFACAFRRGRMDKARSNLAQTTFTLTGH